MLGSHTLGEIGLGEIIGDARAPTFPTDPRYIITAPPQVTLITAEKQNAIAVADAVNVVVIA